MGDKFFSFLILLVTFAGGYIWWNYFYIPENKEISEIIPVTSEVIEKKEIAFIVDNKEIETLAELTQLEEFKIKREARKFYHLGEVNNIYYKFKELDGKIDLYISDTSDQLGKKVNSFQKVEVKKIFMNSVYGTTNIIYIQLDKQQYLYYQQEQRLEKITLTYDIDYIKQDRDNLLFHTREGTFIYNKISKDISYFVLFSDFITGEYDNIGIIKKDDKQRLYRFNLKNNNKDRVVIYNDELKRIKILKEYSEISKIYTTKSGEIWVETNEGNINIQNFE